MKKIVSVIMALSMIGSLVAPVKADASYGETASETEPWEAADDTALYEEASDDEEAYEEVMDVPAFSAEVQSSRAATGSDLQAKLESLQKKYKDTYWTTDGKPSDTNGTTSKKYGGGKQCKAFASYIFNQLFGTGPIGPTNKSDYYITNPIKAKEVGKKYDISTADVKAMISKGQPGDFIQVKRRSGSRCPHSMILVRYDKEQLWIFDCNSDSHCKVRVYPQTYKTFASKNIGMSLYHSTKYPKIALSAPSIQSCAPTSDTTIKLTWGQVANAKEYSVVRTKVAGRKQKTVEHITGTEYTDKGLEANTAYYYNVYAVNGSQKSQKSVAYRTYTRLPTPEFSISQDSDTQLTITWEAVKGADGYKIAYHRAGAGWETLSANLSAATTSYTHKELAPGTKYYYQVIAKRQAPDVGFSNKTGKKIIESSAKTRTKFTMISRPSNEIVDGSPSQVKLSWKAVSGDKDKTYEYNIYRDGVKIKQYVKGTSYTDTGAVSGKIHKYWVQIQEKTGSSYAGRGGSAAFYAGSQISEFTVMPESAAAMKISWDVPAGAPNGVKYHVCKYDDASKKYVKLAETMDPCYTDQGLTAEASYQYYIQIFDRDGNYLTETSSKEAVLEVTPQLITLDKTSLVLTKGERAALKATVTPDDRKPVAWTSSNPAVAAVDDAGEVTAVAAGSAEITAKTENGKTASCRVTVSATECMHEYGDWNTYPAATCQKPGSKSRVCGICGQKETVTIPAAGHSYSEVKITKKPNCQQEGEQARVCTECGDKTDLAVIGVTEHTYGAWKTTKEPTCGEEGSRSRVCSVCGAEETEAIETSSHTYELASQTEPTADAPGTRTYICSICQDSYTENYENVVTGATVSIGGGYSNVGQTITLPVTITDNPGIAGFSLDVNYDKSVLTPVAVTPGDLLKKDGGVLGTFTSNLEEGIAGAELDLAAVTWMYGDADLTGDGVLFYIEFAISSSAPEGSYAVWLGYEDGKITNMKMDDVKPDILDNVITVSDVIRGDVDQDGVLEVRDSIQLARYLAKWKIEFNERQKKAADVYRDGKINTKDGVRLLQLLAGDVQEPENLQKSAARFMRSATTAEQTPEENTPQITVEGFEGMAGDKVYVPVSIAENGGIAGFDLQLTYDSEYLTPVSIEKGELLMDGEFSSNLEEAEGTAPDTIGVHWADTDNLTEDGELFTVEFQIRETAASGQTFSVEAVCGEDMICDGNLNHVDASITPGEIHVVDGWEEPVSAQAEPYVVENVSLQLGDGTVCDEIPANGDFDLVVTAYGTTEEFRPAKIIAASYDAKGAFLGMKAETATQQNAPEGGYRLHMEQTTEEIGSVKVFVWDDQSMAPLAESVELLRE